MSLQVWLPLNGNLDNLGLDGTINITNTGNVAVNNSGKIGKCYEFSGSNYLSTPIDLSQFGTECSLAVWAKLPTHSSGNKQIINIGTASGWNNIRFGLLYRTNAAQIVAAISNGSSAINYSCNADIIENVWNHFVVTYKNHSLKIYINGILAKEYVTTFDPSWASISKVGIGAAPNGNEKLTGLLNDVRIYNHCLSTKEIEEIAKALILHYPLDTEYSNPNLLPDTNVNSLNKVVAPNNRYYEQASSGTYTAVFESIDNPPADGIIYGVHYNVTSVSGFHSITWYNGGTIAVSAQPYTMSCYAKKLSSGTVSIRFQYGKSSYEHNVVELADDNEWHQYSWTFTPATGTGGAAADGTTRMYIGGPSTIGEIIVCGWKLEEGSIATPWCEYNDANTTIYDCSGYSNDGTIVGSLTTVADTPRYGCATSFDENTDSITITPYLSNGQTLNEITVSCWFKTNTLNGTTPNIFSLGENAFLRSRLASATSIWNYYRVVSTQKTTTYSCKNLIDNNWHLLTFTFQDGVEKTYIDGEQIGSTDQSSTGTYLTCNTLDWHLAGYRANSENFIGSLSDFRIYATALTEAQIKELYTTAAAVDKNGNIYARELVEV